MSAFNWNPRRSNENAPPENATFPEFRTNANYFPRSAPSAKGYFAFPPEGHERVVFGQPPATNEEERTPRSDDIDRSEKDRRAKEHALEEKRKQHEEDRQRRLEKEREVASNGEIEWVRSGGILRDASGRRDYARTESIRSELRLQKEEQLLMGRWEAYESSWRRLLTSTDSITFNDIPWPLESAPSAVDELSPAAISDFLLASLRVRTNSVTRKERIRASFLRWHPDKISSVLNRVVEDDVGAVREGISAVLMCLKDLQTTF